MNLFEVSYDVQNATSDASDRALKYLIAMLVQRLGSRFIRRFVASSIVFSTERGYFDVITLIKAWAERSDACFVIAQIMPNEDKARFYYTFSRNESLQGYIDELLVKAKNGEISF